MTANSNTHFTTRTMSSSMIVATAAATTISVSMILWMKWKLNQLIEKKKNEPAVPGFPSPPNAHFIFGHLIQLRNGEVEEDDDNSSKKQQQSNETNFVNGYHTIYEKYRDPKSGRGSFWFFTRPTISLLHGKDVKFVLSTSSYREAINLLDIHTKTFLGKRALVSLMGKEWKLYRTAIHKSFTPRAVKQSQSIICQVGTTLVESLSLYIREGKLQQPTCILPLMKMATIDVFGIAALNYDFKCCQTLELHEIAAAFDYLTNEFTRRVQRPWDPISFSYNIPTPTNIEYQKQQGLIRSFITKQISIAREMIANEELTSVDNPKKKRPSASSNSTSDVLINLIKAAEAEEASKKVSDEALGDVMMTLLFGGIDTTSITLTYALYLLAKHPDIEKTCLEEIHSVIGNDGSGGALILTDGPEQLPYTRAVILETLRLYPPAPVTSRTLEKAITLSNPTVVLEKGRTIMLPIWCIQRNESNYPKPNEIHPERWVRRKTNSSSNNCSDWEERPNDDLQSNQIVPPANRDAFCVFAAGARNCVGRVLAIQESVTLLALLIRKLKFELIHPNYEVQPTVCAVVQQPKDDLPMMIKAR